MFKVGGKVYLNMQHLTCRKIEDENMRRYTDIFGRPVVCLSERYPCFDSYDALYEDRYYNWHFVRHADGVSLVYTDDGNEKAFRIQENISRSEAEGMLDSYNRKRLAESGIFDGLA